MLSQRSISSKESSAGTRNRIPPRPDMKTLQPPSSVSDPASTVATNHPKGVRP